MYMLSIRTNCQSLGNIEFQMILLSYIKSLYHFKDNRFHEERFPLGRLYQRLARERLLNVGDYIL